MLEALAHAALIAHGSQTMAVDTGECACPDPADQLRKLDREHLGG